MMNSNLITTENVRMNGRKMRGEGVNDLGQLCRIVWKKRKKENE
jgi:hypothetical protein